MQGNLDLQLFPSLRKNKITSDENINVHLGIVKKLDSPITIYFKLNDLIDIGTRIHYIAYSMGKRNIIGWGFFDRNKQKFISESQCKYSLKNLNKALSNAKKDKQFQYSGNIVSDKFSSRIMSMVGQKNIIEDYDEYVRYKIAISSYYGKINSEKDEIWLEKKFEKMTGINDLVDDDEYEEKFKSFVQFIERKLEEFEKTINRIDIDRSIKSKLRANVEKLSTLFYQQVKSGSYLYGNDGEKCPDVNKCQGYWENDNCEMYYYPVDDEDEYLL